MEDAKYRKVVLSWSRAFFGARPSRRLLRNECQDSEVSCESILVDNAYPFNYKFAQDYPLYDSSHPIT